MTESAFADRLKELVGATPANQFARRVGIGESLLRKYLAGATPGIDKVVQISRETGASLEWLVAGNGTMFGQPYSFQETQAGVPSHVDLPGFTLVPRLEVEASAGHGSLSTLEQALDLVAFQSAWLRSIGINPPFARVITARGDSMENTIRDGDLLIVDTSVNEVLDNGIYCVVYGNMLLVKRIHVRLNGSIQLISDNPIYPPEEVSPADVPIVSIAGRVGWFGRSI